MQQRFGVESGGMCISEIREVGVMIKPSQNGNLRYFTSRIKKSHFSILFIKAIFMARIRSFISPATYNITALYFYRMIFYSHFLCFFATISFVVKLSAFIVNLWIYF